MGLLDDAIREHLELKRRRGADSEEVSRLEQEALGPPHRGEFAGAAAPAEPDEPVPPAEPEGAAQVLPPTEVASEPGWLEDEPEPEPADEAPADEPTAIYD